MRQKRKRWTCANFLPVIEKFFYEANKQAKKKKTKGFIKSSIEEYARDEYVDECGIVL
jgi:hypothetical protein